jgi:hypothetical protein
MEESAWRRDDMEDDRKEGESADAVKARKRMANNGRWEQTIVEFRRLCWIKSYMNDQVAAVYVEERV